MFENNVICARPNGTFDPVVSESTRLALGYMGLEAYTPITDIELDQIIDPVRMLVSKTWWAAAHVVSGKSVAKKIKRALVVPGSGLVKQQAEEEGLAKIFVDAGFEWRAAGCSMCLGMNPDQLGEGGTLCLNVKSKF